MALVNVPNINQGDSADNTLWNSRYGAIVDALNGGLDSTNLANDAVGTAEIQNGAVTSVKMGPSKSQDANGWTVKDFGTFKTYEKRYTITALSVSSGQRSTAVNATNLPVGIATVGALFWQVAWAGNYGGHAIAGIDSGALTDTVFSLHLGNEYSGSALAFTGNFYVLGTTI